MKEFVYKRCLWKDGNGPGYWYTHPFEYTYSDPDLLAKQGWVTLASTIEPPRTSYENCLVVLFMERDIEKHHEGSCALQGIEFKQSFGLVKNEKVKCNCFMKEIDAPTGLQRMNRS